MANAGGCRMKPFAGELRVNEALAAHTTWRVGGPVDRWYRPADIDDLCSFLGELPANEPLFFLGLGSNLLVRDRGLRGTVVALQGTLDFVERTGRGLRIGAGVPCPRAARVAADEGLVGLEFMAGIPGTVGGALAMNAGAFGAETWQHVASVETVDRRGLRRTRAPAEYSIGYRHIDGPAGEWFVAAEFALDQGDGGAAKERVRDLLARRAATQPTGQPSCGSVFRNPPGDYAGRLIEAAGLKGKAIGGAMVSEKHANFIVNTGAATAADIEALIDIVRETVEQTHGIRLELEVHIVGETA